MIASLRGFVKEIAGDGSSAVLDVGGVGYEVNIDTRTAAQLSALAEGEEVRLYTYLQVREDAMVLFGFLSRDELQLFKKLITVSGIGPKGGLSLISMGADELRFAIASGDTKMISRAPGIGKRTAERLVLELKDKIDVSASVGPDGSPYAPQDGDVSAADPAASDAAQALAALGYSMSDAVRAVKQAKSEGSEDTESLLKTALKYLA